MRKVTITSSVYQGRDTTEFTIIFEAPETLANQIENYFDQETVDGDDGAKLPQTLIDSINAEHYGSARENELQYFYDKKFVFVSNNKIESDEKFYGGRSYSKDNRMGDYFIVTEEIPYDGEKFGEFYSIVSLGQLLTKSAYKVAAAKLLKQHKGNIETAARVLAQRIRQ